MPDTLSAAVESFIAHHALRDQLIVVGVSGGADSLALLHALRACSAAYNIRLHAAHLNHQLRGAESEADARFVEALTREWEIPTTVESHDVAAFARLKKLSVEEAARMVRYGFLEQVAEREGAHAVAVAHNADDQVETILMHFLRGSGLAGMRGIQPVTTYPFHAPLRLVRPLLAVRRIDIEAYCAGQRIDPREDASNTDTHFLRNRLRHEILPLLEQVNPNLRQVLRRSARIIGDDHDYVAQRADGAWKRTLLEQNKDGIAFALAGWRTLQRSLKRRLIRMGVLHLRPELRTLEAQHVEDALQVADHGRIGARATLPAGLWLIRDFDAIFIGEKLPTPDLPHAPAHPMPVTLPGQTALGHGWQLFAQVISAAQLPADALAGIDPLEAFLDADKAGVQLSVRSRLPRDTFNPLGLGSHSKPLRRFMIDAKIPEAWRARTPLLVAGNSVLWIAGWRIADSVKIDDKTRHVLALRFSKEA
jgi:tRNA(Ile)-lysidine synthase